MSLTDCSVGLFIRNFISLVRTLLGSLSPTELDEWTTLGLEAAGGDEEDDDDEDVNGQGDDGDFRLTPSLVSTASKLVPRRCCVMGGDLLVELAVLLLLLTLVLVLLRSSNRLLLTPAD